MSNLILPDPKIIRPFNVSRRGFLRGIGVTALTLAVPKLIVPNLCKTFTYEPYQSGNPNTSYESFDVGSNEDESIYSKVEYRDGLVIRTKFYFLEDKAAFKFYGSCGLQKFQMEQFQMEPYKG